MDWIRNKLESHGPKVACIEGEKQWSYSEFIKQIEDATAALPAEREFIEIGTGSPIRDLASLIAVSDSHHVALPLSPNTPEAEQAKMLQIATSSSLYDQLETSGLILFSSGTTGEPKGMLHRLPALLDRFRKVHTRSDRTLQLLLIDHIGGIDAAIRCLLSGSTLVIPESLSPENIGAAVEQCRVNVLPASPTLLNLLLLANVHQNFDCSSLEIIAYGAEPMPQSLLDRLIEAFPKVAFQQKFGTSETGAVRIKSKATDDLYFRINDSDAEWKIIEGELWLKTPSRIIGYLNAPQDSLEIDGWYRTGDLVEERADHAMRIIGRKSETINVGGQKTHPSEIESTILEIPEIASCRVYAQEDPIMGNRIACTIVTTLRMNTREWKRVIRTHCRNHLASWKIPSNIKVQDTLELTNRLKRDTK